MIRKLFTRLALSGTALLLSSVTALALEAPEIETFTLKNGLEVIVIENDQTNAVSHNLLFRMGAADDPRGKSGLAHYLEHMMFQGTETLEPNEYSQRLAAHGGKSNAFTSQDYTGYWANISIENLPLVMDLESERLKNLAPPVDDFNRERKVILEERSSRIDNKPLALFREQMRAILYYHHPYGTPIIGWPSEMKQLSRADVLEYHKNYYHPDNALLVIAGNISADEVRKLVNKYYANIPAGENQVSPRTKEPVQLGKRAFEMNHPKAGNPFWEKRYLTPSYGWNHGTKLIEDSPPVIDENEIMALMLAEYLLGGSKSSRLYKRLVEQEELATNVSVSYYPFLLGPAEFSLRVQPIEASNISKIEKIIVEEIDRLTTHGPTDKEVERAKIQLIANSTFLRDGLQPIARVIGLLKILNLPLDFYNKWDDNVKAVDAKDIQQSLSLLKENYSVTGVLLPE